MMDYLLQNYECFSLSSYSWCNKKNMRGVCSRTQDEYVKCMQCLKN